MPRRLQGRNQTMAGLGPVRDSASVGFIKFIILHEFGHLKLNHLASGAFPRCAFPADAPSTGNQIDLERQADQYALDEVGDSAIYPSSTYMAPLLFEMYQLLYLQQA